MPKSVIATPAPPNPTTNSCNGDCCEAFTLPFSGDEFWRAFDSWARGETSWTDNSGEDHGIPTDIHLVAPMIRSIGRHRTNPVGAQEYEEPIELFTCIHFNKETRRCGIYEHRPEVCRSYPTNNCCDYQRCTWAAVNDSSLQDGTGGERCSPNDL